MLCPRLGNTFNLKYFHIFYIYIYTYIEKTLTEKCGLTNVHFKIIGYFFKEVGGIMLYIGKKKFNPSKQYTNLKMMTIRM